jgi:ketosteroid isomerase-like protein
VTELIRRWLEAFNTGDVDTLIAASDPEIRIKPVRVMPRAEYVGHDGIRARLSDLAAGPLADVLVTIDSIEVLDASRYVAQGCVNDQPYTTFFDVRGVRISRARGYMTDWALLEQIGELNEWRAAG